MNDSLERAWTSLLNSDQFRRLAKQGSASRLFRSQAYRKLNLARRYSISYYASRKTPDRFQDVKAFCVFVGHNKSGSSMIGSLLDAHPNAIFADEADALQYVPAGFSRDQIFHLLLKGSRREAIKGRVTARRLQPYSFLVPGQWQGRYSRLLVIGDTTTGTTTQRLAGDADLLHRVQNVMQAVQVKFIHVIRNPYDPIGVLMVRGRRTFENALGHYFANCETLVKLRAQTDSSNLLAVRYEDFVHQAPSHLAHICQFLGIEASGDYLQACANILYQSPDRRRHLAEWNLERIEAVSSKMARYDFLDGYSFYR